MSFEFDLSDDGRHDLQLFWSSIDDLKKLQRDLYTSSVAHVQYLDCLDELKEIRLFLLKSGIHYRFRNI